MFNKNQIGLLLKKELEKGYDIVRISRWASSLYFNNIREFPDDLQILLEYLFRMEDDPQFEFSEDELQFLADKLIKGEDYPLKKTLDLVRRKDLGKFIKKELEKGTDLQNIAEKVKEFEFLFSEYPIDLQEIYNLFMKINKNADFVLSKKALETLSESLLNNHSDALQQALKVDEHDVKN
jgi:hypothetical protein